MKKYKRTIAYVYSITNTNPLLTHNRTYTLFTPILLNLIHSNFVLLISRTNWFFSPFLFLKPIKLAQFLFEIFQIDKLFTIFRIFI